MQDLTDCDYFRTPVIFRVPDNLVFVGAINGIEMVEKPGSMLRLPSLYRIKFQNSAANKLKPSQVLSKSMMRSKSLSYAEFCRLQIA
jgi:hypothetical protein